MQPNSDNFKKRKDKDQRKNIRTLSKKYVPVLKGQEKSKVDCPCGKNDLSYKYFINQHIYTDIHCSM